MNLHSCAGLLWSVSVALASGLCAAEQPVFEPPAGRSQSRSVSLGSEDYCVRGVRLLAGTAGRDGISLVGVRGGSQGAREAVEWRLRPGRGPEQVAIPHIRPSGRFAVEERLIATSTGAYGEPMPVRVYWRDGESQGRELATAGAGVEVLASEGISYVAWIGSDGHVVVHALDPLTLQTVAEARLPGLVAAPIWRSGVVLEEYEGKLLVGVVERVGNERGVNRITALDSAFRLVEIWRVPPEAFEGLVGRRLGSFLRLPGGMAYRSPDGIFRLGEQGKVRRMLRSEEYPWSIVVWVNEENWVDASLQGPLEGALGKVLRSRDECHAGCVHPAKGEPVKADSFFGVRTDGVRVAVSQCWDHSSYVVVFEG